MLCRPISPDLPYVHLEPRRQDLVVESRVLVGGEAGQRRSNAMIIPWREIQEHPW